MMENERDVEFTPTPGLDRTSDVGTSPGGFDATRGIGAAGAGSSTNAGRGAAGATDTMSGSGSQGSANASGSAKGTAQQVKERAVDEVESRISEQKHRAADSLGDVAQSLRTAGQQLPDDNGMGQYVLKAANQVDNLANMLNNQEVAELVDGVEDFARRQPAAFIGSAFAIGMIGARFLKSSQRDIRDDRHRGEWSTSQLDNRLPATTRDAVARPDAPGYAPPSSRDLSGDGTGGYS